MVLLLVCCPLSSIASNASNENKQIFVNSNEPLLEKNQIPVTNPWIDSSIYQRINSGDSEVRITAITWSIKNLNDWQQKYNIFERQAPASDLSLIHI